MKLIAKLVALAVCYGIAGFILYRARCLTHAPIWSSDFIVFFLPFTTTAIIAMVVSYRDQKDLSKVARLLASVAIGIVVPFLAMWAYMVIVINKYGA